jgi:hypothetical protein
MPTRSLPGLRGLLAAADFLVRDLLASLPDEGSGARARAVDSYRIGAALAWSALGGGLLIRANRVLPLTGLPGHPWLRPDSALLAVVARRVADGAQHAAFLWPAGEVGNDGRVLRRVTVLVCGDERASYAHPWTGSGAGARGRRLDAGRRSREDRLPTARQLRSTT